MKKKLQLIMMVLTLNVEVPKDLIMLPWKIDC